MTGLMRFAASIAKYIGRGIMELINNSKELWNDLIHHSGWF